MDENQKLKGRKQQDGLSPLRKFKRRERGEWNILHGSIRMNSVSLDEFDRWHRPEASTSTSAVQVAVMAADQSQPADVFVGLQSVQEDVTRRECTVCRESDLDVAFGSSPPTDRCLHQPEVCMDCLSQTLRTAIMGEGNVKTLRCPSAECKELLEYDEVYRWADLATLERYEELLTQAMLREEAGYVTCIDPACGASQVHGGENIFPIVTCWKCGKRSCWKHRVPWEDHEGFNCREWDTKDERRAQAEELSREWVQEQTKRCPAPGCNRPIKKEEGCDHMTCRRPGGCGFEFCWVCLAPYEPIREFGCEKHEPFCRYYTGAPPAIIGTTRARPRWQFWRRDHGA